jgi:hypothetical protein
MDNTDNPECIEYTNNNVTYCEATNPTVNKKYYVDTNNGNESDPELVECTLLSILDYTYLLNDNKNTFEISKYRKLYTLKEQTTAPVKSIGGKSKRRKSQKSTKRKQRKARRKSYRRKH